MGCGEDIGKGRGTWHSVASSGELPALVLLLSPWLQLSEAPHLQPCWSGPTWCHSPLPQFRITGQQKIIPPLACPFLLTHCACSNPPIKPSPSSPLLPLFPLRGSHHTVLLPKKSLCEVCCMVWLCGISWLLLTARYPGGGHYQVPVCGLC